MFNAIQYLPGTGCQWRALPPAFPPFTTVQNYSYAWRDSGVLGQMLTVLRKLVRALSGLDSEGFNGFYNMKIKLNQICGRHTRKRVEVIRALENNLPTGLDLFWTSSPRADQGQRDRQVRLGRRVRPAKEPDGGRVRHQDARRPPDDGHRQH